MFNHDKWSGVLADEVVALDKERREIAQRREEIMIRAQEISSEIYGEETVDLLEFALCFLAGKKGSTKAVDVEKEIKE